MYYKKRRHGCHGDYASAFSNTVTELLVVVVVVLCVVEMYQTMR